MRSSRIECAWSRVSLVHASLGEFYRERAQFYQGAHMISVIPISGNYDASLLRILLGGHLVGGEPGYLDLVGA